MLPFLTVPLNWKAAISLPAVLYFAVCFKFSGIKPSLSSCALLAVAMAAAALAAWLYSCRCQLLKCTWWTLSTCLWPLNPYACSSQFSQLASSPTTFLLKICHVTEKKQKLSISTKEQGVLFFKKKHAHGSQLFWEFCLLFPSTYGFRK